jgi:hypothetical protein
MLAVGRRPLGVRLCQSRPYAHMVPSVFPFFWLAIRFCLIHLAAPLAHTGKRSHNFTHARFKRAAVHCLSSLLPHLHLALAALLMLALSSTAVIELWPAGPGC